MDLSPALAAAGIDERLRTALFLIGTFAGSLAFSALLWRWLGSRMRRDGWVRPNYRGQPIVAVGGLVVVAVSVAAVALTAAIRVVTWAGEQRMSVLTSNGELAIGRSPSAAAAAGGMAVLFVLVGFGWLGYRDDTRGHLEGLDTPRGFAGHLRLSWQRRRLTTGTQKAIGGLLAALVGMQIGTWGDPSDLVDWVRRGFDGWADGGQSLLGVFTSAMSPSWSPLGLLRGALIVALGANLLNLADRAPGRATKAALAWWLAGLVPAAVAATCSPDVYGLGPDPADWAVWAAAATGAASGLLRSELAEEHMQGDTGVNPVGAVLGLATVAMYSPGVEWVVLAVLAALNVASERWSFSRIIDAVPPLRWLDRLGSPHRSY